MSNANFVIFSPPIYPIPFHSVEYNCIYIFRNQMLNHVYRYSASAVDLTLGDVVCHIPLENNLDDDFDLNTTPLAAGCAAAI